MRLIFLRYPDVEYLRTDFITNFSMFPFFSSSFFCTFSVNDDRDFGLVFTNGASDLSRKKSSVKSEMCASFGFQIINEDSAT